MLGGELWAIHVGSLSKGLAAWWREVVVGRTLAVCFWSAVAVPVLLVLLARTSALLAPAASALDLGVAGVASVSLWRWLSFGGWMLLVLVIQLNNIEGILPFDWFDWIEGLTGS